MSKKTDPSPERQVLRSELRRLEGAALRGRNRTDAIAETNRRLQEDQLPQLSPTTVGGWFEKGTPAQDFNVLWALVEVLLEWSGQPRPDTLTGPARATAAARWTNTKELWKTRWEQARAAQSVGAAPDWSRAAVKAYLAAVHKTAGAHPYPDLWGDTHLPDLTDVYVRQQATPQTDEHDGPGPSSATPARSAVGRAQHAEEVFLTGSSITVLLAPAGSGKSTLLRTYRAASAGRWLDGEVDAAVPVLVNATALARAAPLPAALAKATTGELTRRGLLEELTADLFRHPPRHRTPWLVLIDGLDEIPEADTRRTMLQLLTQTAAAQPALYRFVVATRPLPTRELHDLGSHVPRFELQLFSPQDLRTYATNWLQDLDDPARHAQTFMAGLARTGLDVLARTPLIAFLLCRLYKADPGRPLPNGRSGVYQECIELLYDLNTHKDIKTTHDEAIRHLKNRHQIPRDNLAAEQAARQVRENLPELIDYLAHTRINGNTAPATEILTSHLHVIRPPRLKERLWHAFIGDLLRPTGLLTEHEDDFHFRHQTFLEYHAARHTTRDEQACTRLLDQLFPPGRQPRVPNPEPSYLGFLLDALLSSPGGIADETTSRIEALTSQGGSSTCAFLVEQVDFKTRLPTKPTASRLTCFARNEALDGFTRVQAAQGLAGVEGYRDAGVDRLTALADDTALHGFERMRAAEALAGMEGHRDLAAQTYAQLAADTTLHVIDRWNSAEVLTAMEGYRDLAAQTYAQLAADTTLHGTSRVKAAETLAEMDEYQIPGADHLVCLTRDTTLDGFARTCANEVLAGMEGYRDLAAQTYAQLAADTTHDGSTRRLAAEALAGMEGYRDLAAQTYAQLAADTTVGGLTREGAAEALAGMDEYRDMGVHHLISLTSDATLDGLARAWATEALTDLGLGVPDSDDEAVR
ncbi:hypothetical protein IF129_12265 [Streptomyces chumphonensis]|uniref:NACHT domain-containing protein n=1 Tax=Streptomyces chumphonensis TaxID=1214925 RepID=A0A927ID55_9ACTN|nr:NACHT domain-containing protein [Streptomyces chumphonensis]MBD3932324.1 hypothetical protein [Streptomyces chumphonensis]